MKKAILFFIIKYTLQAIVVYCAWNFCLEVEIKSTFWLVLLIYPAGEFLLKLAAEILLPKETAKTYKLNDPR